MAEVITLNLDLCPAFIPFNVQTTDGNGAKINPTVDNLIIYEEDGANGNEIVAADEIGNSPFDPVQLPTDAGKTGFWGINIDKTNFTAGKFYLFLWELTVDGETTAKTETYHFVNSSSFKADVTFLDAAVSTRAAADVMDADLTALSVLINAIDTSAETKARFDEIKGAGWTDETLKAIKDAVDLIKTENYNGSGY